MIVNRQKTKQTIATTGGFTLIEMLVATALFSLAMLIIVGALISLQGASRKARAIRAATDNVSAAVDSMTRTMRMGSVFHCDITKGVINPLETRSCPMSPDLSNGRSSIAFTGQDGLVYQYRLSENSIQRSVNYGAWRNMTAPEITITKLLFFAGGTKRNQDQPFVTIVVAGTAIAQGGVMSTAFDVETLVAARTPNYQF
jgi:prepilin-type N-terminal cleavage/methylation domain-containing protein